jgi:hypothetical protein
VVRPHHGLELPLLRLRQALPQRALHVRLHAFASCLLPPACCCCCSLSSCPCLCIIVVL